MKLILYFFVTYIFVSTPLLQPSQPSYKNLKSNLFSLIRNNADRGLKQQTGTREKNALKKFRSEGKSNEDEKAHFRLDPVLNFLRRNARRESSAMAITSSEGSSSSLELKDFKDEWREQWILKKFEAINSTGPFMGDTVNMAGARPWGVPCGDPNQHDMPWGTCMLPMECDAEYRIYRGDFNCGRTQFVCCALQLTTYDMYTGFDISFEDSGLRTDSYEKKQRGKGSKEDSKKQRHRQKRRREAARKRRKRQIRRLILKIQKEIKRIINSQDRQASQARKIKTKQLKKFIDLLRAQYKRDRKAVHDIHEHEIIKIDDTLKKKLHEISDLNNNFIWNATFKDIVVNGTLNRQAARMLIEAYPELESEINLNVKRRSGSPVRDYTDYDVEFGMLYY